MTELLIIADDLTGAIDAAASCIGAGVEVLTACPESLTAELGPSAPRVLSVNAATRHLPAAEARACVQRLVADARTAGVRLVIKKTDSVLRGNVGAELEGALAASGVAAAHFIPSFPAMDRVTTGGVHRASGVPVAESPLGQDPFEPVLFSDISSIISTTSRIPTMVVAEGEAVPERARGVIAYDAATDAAIEERLRQVLRATECDPMVLLAGCAGMVSALARVLRFPSAPSSVAPRSGSLLTFCGSINAVSAGQCAHARRSGAPSIALAPRMLLDEAWPSSTDFLEVAHEVSTELVSHRLVVVDASTRSTSADLTAAGIAPGTDVRLLVARNLGAIAAGLLACAQVENIMVMGGDVLLEMLENLCVPRLSLVAQVAVGVVVFEAMVGPSRVRIVSKSGGFGEPDMFLRVADALCVWHDDASVVNQFPEREKEIA